MDIVPAMDCRTAEPVLSSTESVLLYYQYQPLAEAGVQEGVRRFLDELCSALGILGRVRVARDGVNVTIRGTNDALQQHIDAVRAHPLLGAGPPIDFKLAPACANPSPQVTLETGFNKLSVKCCKEVVTLGPAAGTVAASLDHTGEHLSPQAFHQLLTEASQTAQGGEPGVVLVDTRNVYESAIGRFEVAGVRTLAPPLRAFSDLPAWLAAHQADLRGRKVLMYCTGGVRCERASAFLRYSGGPGLQDVAQLQGGIQRYLEQHADGGHFRGKNFVFDERIAAGPAAAPPSAPPLGACTACARPCDDYSARARCHHCRMLLLLCAPCREARTRRGEGASKLVCELCANAPPPHPPQPSRSRPPLTSGGGPGAKEGRVRVLCLHGFRQTGSSLRGRTAALRRRLQDVADLAYMDAPHLLPMYYKPRPTDPAPAPSPAPSSSSSDPATCPRLEPPACPGDLPTASPPSSSSCCQGPPPGARQAASDGGGGGDGEDGAELPSLLDDLVVPGPEVEEGACEAGGERVGGKGQEGGERGGGGQPRRAWMFSAELPAAEEAPGGASGPAVWTPAPPHLLAAFDEKQYKAQTSGWEASVRAVESYWREHGPFDGILAFSQGTALASALCALQTLRDRRAGPDAGVLPAGADVAAPEAHAAAPDPDAGVLPAGADVAAPEAHAAAPDPDMHIRFVIMCSGYCSYAEEHRRMYGEAAPMDIPSLHIFGTDDNDRQIDASESEALLSLFAQDRCTAVRHGAGHIIPTGKTNIATYKAFLSQFRGKGVGGPAEQ